MMISRFAGPVMTIAVGYLIPYAIDSHHSLAAAVKAPGVWNGLASFSSGVINITPELVFPGTVVLCIQALTRKNWFHGALYAIASVAFAWLTLALLNAYMSNGIDNSFLSGMLLWRAASSLFYIVVAELCSRHAFSSVESTEHYQQQRDAFHQQIQQFTQVQNAQAETLSQRLQEAEKNLQRAMIERLQLLQPELQTTLAEKFQLSLRRRDVSHTGRFNKTRFVTECLKENAAMTASEIKEHAANMQQSISDSIISMARATFKNQQLKEVELEKVVGD